MQRTVQFWKSGTRGKLMIGCSSLLTVLCLCGFMTLLLPTETTQQTSEEPAATQAAAGTKPTKTPGATESPLPTDTPRPTDAPQSTLKPEFSPVPATATSIIPRVVARADGVNLRSGPGTDFTRVGYLEPGAEAQVTGCYGDWWQIEYNGAECWVYGEIVNAFNAENVPQVEPPPSPTPAPPTATPLSTKPPAATAAPVLPTDTPHPVEPAPPPGDYLATGVWRCPNSTEGAVYVGSLKSDKFHVTQCSYAIKIEPGNRICFESREAALNYNYTPCGRCKP